MITVKEEFLTDDKTCRAIKLGGYEVLALWLAMKRYTAKNLTDGFVPDEDIDDLKGAPKNPRKALKALVECGDLQPDGSRKGGLVDKEEHGWRLHNYLDHAVSREEELERRQRARERKAKWRAGPTGDVPPGVPDDVPPNDWDTEETPRETSNGTPTGQSGDDVPRARDQAGAPTPPTQPNPTGSDPDPTPLPPARDSKGSAKPKRERPERRPSSTAIPEPFALTNRHIEYARGKNWPDWWVRGRHERFVELAQAKGWRYADWNLALYTFLRGEIDYGRGPEQLAHTAPKGTPRPAQQTAESWSQKRDRLMRDHTVEELEAMGEMKLAAQKRTAERSGPTASGPPAEAHGG